MIAVCARASALARVPSRSSPGGTRLALLVRIVGGIVGGRAQAEETARGLDVEGLGRVGAVAPQRGQRRMQDLVDDRHREPLDDLLLARFEGPEGPEAPLKLAATDRVELLAQRDDG